MSSEIYLSSPSCGSALSPTRRNTHYKSIICLVSLENHSLVVLQRTSILDFKFQQIVADHFKNRMLCFSRRNIMNERLPMIINIIRLQTFSTRFVSTSLNIQIKPSVFFCIYCSPIVDTRHFFFDRILYDYDDSSSSTLTGN